MSALLHYFRTSAPSQHSRAPTATTTNTTRTDSFHTALAGPHRRPGASNTALPGSRAIAEESYRRTTENSNFWVSLAKPCLTFGRTRQRLIDLDNGESGLDDSLRKEGIAACMECFGVSLFGGWGVQIGRERRHIRQRLGLPGSQVRDFIGSCLCPCAAVQEQDQTVFKYCIENYITTQPTPSLPMTVGDAGSRSSFITLPGSMFTSPRPVSYAPSSNQSIRSVPNSLPKDGFEAARIASLDEQQICRICTVESSPNDDFLARVKAEALSIVGDAFGSDSSIDASQVDNGAGNLSDCTRLEQALVTALAAGTTPVSIKQQSQTRAKIGNLTIPPPAVTAPVGRIPPRLSGRQPPRRAFSANYSISTMEEEDSDDAIVASVPPRNPARDTWPLHPTVPPKAAVKTRAQTDGPALRRKPRFAEAEDEVETAEMVSVQAVQSVSRRSSSSRSVRRHSANGDPDLLIRKIDVRQRPLQITPVTPQSSHHGTLSTTSHPASDSRVSQQRDSSPVSRDGKLATRRNFFEKATSRSKADQTVPSSGISPRQPMQRGMFPSRRESNSSSYSIGTKARLQAVGRRWHCEHVRAVSEPRYTFDELRDLGNRARGRQSPVDFSGGISRGEGRFDGPSSAIEDNTASESTGTRQRHSPLTTSPGTSADGGSERSVTPNFPTATDSRRNSPDSIASSKRSNHGRSASVPEVDRDMDDIEFLRGLRIDRYLGYWGATVGYNVENENPHLMDGPAPNKLQEMPGEVFQVPQEFTEKTDIIDREEQKRRDILNGDGVWWGRRMIPLGWLGY